MFWVGLQVDRAHNVAGNAQKPHQAMYCVRENRKMQKTNDGEAR